MGHRLTKIYTRTGDEGTTGMGDGSRVPKTHARIQAIGDVDELNCHIGLVLCEELPDEIRACLTQIQHRLFDFGGALSVPGYELIKEEMVVALEQTLDHLNGELPPLKEFILPGGSRAATLCHVARSVCRRAERSLCALAEREDVSPVMLRYLNRMSDLLFVVARAINHGQGHPEVFWKAAHKSSD